MKAATIVLGRSTPVPCAFRRPMIKPSDLRSILHNTSTVTSVGYRKLNVKDTVPMRGSVAVGSSKDSKAHETDSGINIGSIGIGLLWVSLVAYIFFLSPNQTPYRDQIFIKLLTGISKDSTFSVNQVYFSVFNIIGLYTFFFQCFLIPGGRSGNKIPAWPFVVTSFGLGAMALLPYFALWRPSPGLKMPPPPEELEGWSKVGMKGGETTVVPAIALAASLYLLYNAFSADSAAWAGYLRLFEESRLVHVSTIDLATLTALAPFWMSNDAELRGWKDREKLLPILSILPVVGPATYLLLRPKSGDEDSS